MNEELLFHVQGSEASRATPISLVEAGLREREHLQEWVLANPDIVSPGLLVISSEYDRWLPAAATSSTRAVRDRLDVLGLEDDGRLVVIELKRDRAADTVEMQAIKYAAMVAQFTPDQLARTFADHLTRRGEPIPADEAKQRLQDHVEGSLDSKILRQPRIVLIAGEFLDTTMTTAVWLTQMGVEVELIRYQAYRTSAEIVISTSRLWPIDEVENLVVRPEEREEAAAEQRERRHTVSVVARIVEAELISEGTRLELILEQGQLSHDRRDVVREWLDEDPARGRAAWVNHNPRCLRWALDGKVYSTSGLAIRIVKEATGDDIEATGPQWWRLPDGRALYEVLEDHTGQPVYEATTTRRDWSDLHQLLDEIPAGRWTSYGDLAAAVGSHANPVGQHLAACSECTNGHRVLSGEGTISPGFRWSDPHRTDDPQAELEREGVRFDDQGRASPDQKVAWT